MLRITGPQNPAKVEDEIRAVVAAPDDRLQLPVHPQEWWLGGELGIIELVITWARLNDKGALITHIPPTEDGKRPVKCVLRGGVGWCRVSFSQQGVWHGTAGTAD